MKWFFFQTKKPKHNKTYLFFDHRGRLRAGRYLKWEYDSEEFENVIRPDGYYECYGDNSLEVYRFSLEQVKNINLIQYWCYFSSKGLGALVTAFPCSPDKTSEDQSPPTEDEIKESETGQKWNERYLKMIEEKRW